MYLTEDAFVLHIKKSTGSRCSYWPDVNAGPLVSLKKKREPQISTAPLWNFMQSE